ncbi:sulfatase-like hydrolase/transferase [Rubritalea tangerina]|uniref:Sulfatase-like hydrolase/transferase n=1 Tax=Rubritalea tangerina TaxID=430798 RepID=A0ABW4ZAN4_9BACT
MKKPIQYLSALGAMVLSAAAAADRPNIIFILCDDLGPGDIGVLWQNQREGKQKYTTPQLDIFAKEGMILDRHYAPAPVCAPSRGSLLTGQHQGHCSIRDNQFDRLLPDEHTIGSVLQEAGYKTAVIGKWGLQGGSIKKGKRGDRSAELEPSHPLERGFDYFYGYTAHVDGHFQYAFEKNRPVFDGYKDVTDELEKCYSTDLFTARAKKWIIDHVKQNPEQPFFTYLAYTSPHAGLRVPTDSHMSKDSNYPKGGGLKGGVQWNDDPSDGRINTAKGNFDKGIHPLVAKAEGDDGKPWPQHAKRHVSMVKRIDDSVADLVQLLKDLKVDDNTLIVFTSDNGTHHEGGADNVGVYKPDYLATFGRFDGIKRDLWEGGVRMPTLVRWPAKVAAGSLSEHPSQFHDWMATFCELAGVAEPALSDGVSLVPSLTGEGEQEEGTVYVEYGVGGGTPKYKAFEESRRGQKHGQMQSVYTGRFKGVRTQIGKPDKAFEVYDVVSDPKETKNLAGKDGAPSQKELEAKFLRARRASASAKRPYDKELVPALEASINRPGKVKHRVGKKRNSWVPSPDLVSGEAKLVDGFVVQDVPGVQVFETLVNVPSDGAYHFELVSNGQAVVRLHEALLIDADSHYKAGTKKSSGAIYLSKGAHPMTVVLQSEKGKPKLQIKWKGAEDKFVPLSKENIGL